MNTPNHKEQTHHITLQIEALGNGPAHHVDLAVTAGALRDVFGVVAGPYPSLDDLEPITDQGPANGTPDIGHFTVDPITPAFTQANADAGESPPIASEFKVHGDENCDDGFCYMKCVAHHYKGGVIGMDGMGMLNHISGGYFPVDNRTDKMKLWDALMDALNHPNLSPVLGLLASDKFTITLKG